jgi:hypothetical protein
MWIDPGTFLFRSAKKYVHLRNPYAWLCSCPNIIKKALEIYL